MRHLRFGSLFATVMLLTCVFCCGSARCEDETPTKIYQKYFDVLLKAQTVDEIKPYMAKDVITKIDASPPDEKKFFFGMIKSLTPTVIHVQSETVDGDKASLKVLGEKTPDAKPKEGIENLVSDKQTGDISMVKEDGTWKVEKEAWKGDNEVIK